MYVLVWKLSFEFTFQQSFEIHKVTMIHFLNYYLFMVAHGWELIGQKGSFQSICASIVDFETNPKKVWEHEQTHQSLLILALLRALILHMPRRHQNCQTSMLLKATIEVVKKKKTLPPPSPFPPSTTRIPLYITMSGHNLCGACCSTPCL